MECFNVQTAFDSPKNSIAQASAL